MIKLVPSLGIVAVLSFTLFAFAGENAPVKKDPSSPRYKLRLGQELNYAGESEVTVDRGNRKSLSSWKLLVVRQNFDGGWRLFVRYGIQRQRKAKDSDEMEFGKEHVTLGWCDLTPDGRVADNPTLDFSFDVRPLLPQLPPPGQATWSYENGLTRAREECTLADAADEGHIAIADVSHGPTDDIYLTTEKSTISFDKKRGLVDRVESETTQGYGTSTRQTTVLTLQEVKQVDPNLATFVAVEMADYFAVRREYEELVDLASKEPQHTADLLARAKPNLEDLRAALRTEILQKQLDDDIALHAAAAKSAEEQAERFAAVLDKPSPTWETTDLAGGARSIEACRGKVVVLDFWYRGCGWCIRAMPQVKQLAAHYQGQPVEIFGMNTDDDEADARFVVDKLGLTYPTLKADGLPEKYGVHGFPTLVIIDGAGVVRDFHVGYTPTLAKSVMASVDKLLAETAPAK